MNFSFRKPKKTYPEKEVHAIIPRYTSQYGPNEWNNILKNHLEKSEFKCPICKGEDFEINPTKQSFVMQIEEEELENNIHESSLIIQSSCQKCAYTILFDKMLLQELALERERKVLTGNVPRI